MRVNPMLAGTGTTNVSEVYLHPDGSVQFMDRRVSRPITFAHVADTHLYPPPENRDDINHAYRATSCNKDLKSLVTPYARLEQLITRMMDDIAACEVDFVSFSGDILECYHPESARMLVDLCAERGLTAYFQMGNHDWDTEWPVDDRPHGLGRLPSQQYDLGMRNGRAEKVMCGDWGMPGLYYSFESKGVRFVCLDTIHRSRTPTMEGKISSFYGETQANWLIEQLAYDGPIVVFQHVPFNPMTADYRPEPWPKFVYGCVANDEETLRVRAAIENCPNVLGVFVAHKHFRSEDPLGNTRQFMIGLACEGDWRLVKIADTPLPEDSEASGEPAA
jgi:hypothetical protein